MFSSGSPSAAGRQSLAVFLLGWSPDGLNGRCAPARHRTRMHTAWCFLLFGIAGYMNAGTLAGVVIEHTSGRPLSRTVVRSKRYRVWVLLRVSL